MGQEEPFKAAMFPRLFCGCPLVSQRAFFVIWGQIVGQFDRIRRISQLFRGLSQISSICEKSVLLFGIGRCEQWGFSYIRITKLHIWRH